MKIIFANVELSDMYEGHRPKRKELKSNPSLVKQYVKTIAILESATKIEDLMQFGSLHYKKPKDDPEGMSAVRINKQYRLHFKEITNDEDPPLVVLLEIHKITDHYKSL